MSRIEHGRASPSLDAVQVLADAQGVEVFKLFIVDGDANVGDIGAGNTKHFTDFSDALAYLHAQRTAKKPVKGWRPDNKGHWGLVTAVR